MNKFTIKNILVGGLGVIVVIWGVIFFLAFSDHSYHLFMPKVALPSISLPTLKKAAKQEEAVLPDSGPWKQDLLMVRGDGSSYGGPVLMAHGAATPSAILKSSDLIVYFNFFPKDQRRVFGQIYSVKSSDQGNTWTQPSPVTIENLPTLSYSPFSPKALILPNGKIKMFFLSKKPGETNNKLFSAISDDGVKFVFDPSTTFGIENESMIAFTLTVLDDKVQLLAYTDKGSSTNTVYHAVSYDGKVFTRLADIKIADSFYGQSSILSDNGKLMMVGTSSKGIWNSTSSDGNSWSAPSYVDFRAQDPAVIKTGDTFKLFYTSVVEQAKN